MKNNVARVIALVLVGVMLLSMAATMVVSIV